MLAAFSILAGTGCSEHPASNATIQSVSTKANPALKELEARVAMTFPTNAILVNATDGGGRDPSYGFYAWTVFSPSQIKMPPMPAPGIQDYVNLPLEDAVKMLDGLMHKRKVTQPQAAFMSEWQTNGFDFRGTLVRSATGDYLAIEQFRKK